MTSTADPAAEPAEPPAPAAGAQPRSGDAGGPAWRAELGLALEVGALTALAFSRPVLDSFGRSPETFVARGADAATIVLFGLVVAVAPVAVVAAVGTAGRLAGPAARRWLHLVVVALLGGAAAWRLGQDVTGWPGDATKILLAAAVAVPVAGAVRWRFPSAGTFLRYAGAASLVFLGQFLFTSPASSLVLGQGPQVDDGVAASVAAQLGDDPPDVVLVVFDALPLRSLLDGAGRIDAGTFPNLGRLAATSTWYRNATTNAIYTGYAVPTLLTGRLPPTGQSEADDDAENLFTLLGGSYEVHAAEQVTALCPRDVCGRPPSPGLKRLLGDAVDLWWDGTRPGGAAVSDVPGALEDDRYDTAARWIDDLPERRGDRPRLIVQHVMLPHGPFVVTDDGTPYEAVSDTPTGMYGAWWTEAGTAVGRQRHLLQARAADRLLGRLLDRLEEDGSFDDALVVVTADHGEAFVPGEPDRELTEANADHIAWVPLLVRSPGQDRARVDDANVQSVDVVPTIADELGIDLPWPVDGLPAPDASEERASGKPIADYTKGELSDAGELSFVQLDAERGLAEVLAADAVPGEGADAVWQLTAHGGLVGEAPVVAPSAAAAGAVEVERLDDLERQASDRRLVEVVGHTRLPAGSIVAYALDGAVVAVTEVGPGTRGGLRLAHALVPPALFDDGRNDLTAYLVEGPVGGETFRPVTVLDAR